MPVTNHIIPVLNAEEAAVSASIRRAQITEDINELTLSFRQTISAWPMGGMPSVTVTRGVVWITQTGDARDHILRAGQELMLGHHGQIVLQAIHRDGVELRLNDLRRSNGR